MYLGFECLFIFVWFQWIYIGYKLWIYPCEGMNWKLSAFTVDVSVQCNFWNNSVLSSSKSACLCDEFKLSESKSGTGLRGILCWDSLVEGDWYNSFKKHMTVKRIIPVGRTYLPDSNYFSWFALTMQLQHPWIFFFCCLLWCLYTKNEVFWCFWIYLMVFLLFCYANLLFS